MPHHYGYSALLQRFTSATNRYSANVDYDILIGLRSLYRSWPYRQCQ